MTRFITVRLSKGGTMQELYYIDTENRHGQLIVFETYDGARDWMKRATRLNDDEIEARIFRTVKTWQGFYSVLPRDVVGR